jgi:hypothetical protein
MKSILIFSDYFGIWPQWFDMYLESCRQNPTVEWCIHTDCPEPAFLPPNVTLIHMTFDEYCERVSQRLSIVFRPNHPYNLCNLKPMFGIIHADLVNGYDYFGWGDIDVIYGDIRAFYDDKVLTHNMVSAHAHTCSGHLTLMKNESWLKNAYRHIHGWRERLEDPRPCEWKDSLDEAHLTAIFTPTAHTRADFSAMTGTSAPNQRYFTGNYFVEQWSTPFTPLPWLNSSFEHPETWFWHDGRVTNSDDDNRQFLYLHLMNFKAPCWVNASLYSGAATWKQLDNCMTFTIDAFHHCPSEARRIRIDRQGLHLD